MPRGLLENDIDNDTNNYAQQDNDAIEGGLFFVLCFYTILLRKHTLTVEVGLWWEEAMGIWLGLKGYFIKITTPFASCAIFARWWSNR